VVTRSLSVVRTNSQVAAYPSAPYAYDEAPPAATYLGRLMPNTRGPARYRLERLAAMLSGGKFTALVMPWHKVTYSQVMNLRVALEREYPDSPGTRNNYLISLRGVLKECWDAGYIEDRAYRRLIGVPMFSVPKHGPRPGRHVELAEVRALVESIRQDERPVAIRDLAIVAALFGGGLRRSEVVALTVKDWTGSTFEVRNGKGGKSRTVPVPAWAARAIESWLDLRGREPAHAALFVSYRGCTWNHGGQHMRATSVRDILDARIKVAGIERFRPHDARRTYIGESLDAGTDLATCAELVGHADVRVTASYDHRGKTRRMSEAAERLPDPFST
jgi:integrase/recombinase XerD